MNFFTVFAFLTVIGLSTFGGDLNQAPPSLNLPIGTTQSIDILNLDLELKIDNGTKKAQGLARITFQMRAGLPMFLMKPKIMAASIDGIVVNSKLFLDYQFETTNTVRVLNHKLAAGVHVLSVNYDATSFVDFTSGNPRFAFWMWDIGSASFLEQFGPSNFEFDHFAMRLMISPSSLRSLPQIFTNGNVTQLKTGWLIQFPPYFTMSSFFLHFTDTKLYVEKFVYKGLARSIPMTIYSDVASSVAAARAQTIASFTELEKTFGPYPHASFTLYLDSKELGGMEYVGATVTSQGAINHEIGHSWFARGVMPALGRDGWIDENIITWRDKGYEMRESQSRDPSAFLSGYSAFEIGTSRYTYRTPFMSGVTFISGSIETMKQIIKKFYISYVYKSVTTIEFKRFLETELKQDLSAFFTKYVYNAGASRTDMRQHPIHRRYTPAQLKRLL